MQPQKTHRCKDNTSPEGGCRYSDRETKPSDDNSMAPLWNNHDKQMRVNRAPTHPKKRKVGEEMTEKYGVPPSEWRRAQTPNAYSQYNKHNQVMKWPTSRPAIYVQNMYVPCKEGGCSQGPKHMHPNPRISM